MNTSNLLLSFFFLSTIFCHTSTGLRNLDIYSDASKYMENYYTCTRQSSASSSQCPSVNSQLISTGVYANVCCYINYYLDLSTVYRLVYGQKYKEYLPTVTIQEIEACTSVLTTAKNTGLYTFALLTTNKQINYNCGDGYKTLKASEYNPTSETDKLGKEIADCTLNIEKNDCLSNAEDFSTGVQCCWFSLNINGVDISEYLPSKCIGVTKVTLENFNGVEAGMTEVKRISGNSDVTSYKFNCRNKNGKSATGTYEYKVTGGSINFESNEQDYSNLIGLKILSLVLIGLLI